jgi:hypothetical protein
VHNGPRKRITTIPLHRSVRMVHYKTWRLVFWILFSLAGSLSVAWTGPVWSAWYAKLDWLLLSWARVPFAAVTAQTHLMFPVTAWKIPIFNPVANLRGALTYGCVSLVLLAISIKARRLSMPARAWIGVPACLLLLSTIVLYIMPIPRLDPVNFSSLWSQVTLGTLLLLPWAWALIVGILPLPIWRSMAFLAASMVVVFCWSATRLALVLTLAYWAGAVWLPPAFVLGCAIPDILVVVVAYGYALEPAGTLWGGRR